MPLNLFPERRAITPEMFRTGRDAYPSRTESGVAVDDETALGATAIWAVVRLLASDISTLPLDAFIKQGTVRTPLRPKPSWIDTPQPADPSYTRIVHVAQIAISLLLDGNAFVTCAPSTFDAVSLACLNPLSVVVRKPPLGSPSYDVKDAAGKTVTTLDVSQVVHIQINPRPGALRGMSPIAANAESIGLALAAQKFTARFFGTGAMVPGFIELPGVPREGAIEKMERTLNARHSGLRNSWRLGFLTGGAKWTPTGVSPRDADVIALRKYQLEEAARAYGVPPHKLQSQEPGAVGYASVEQRAIDYTETLLHYVEPIETALARLVPGPDTYLKFNLAKKLRADVKTRYEAYGIGLDKGFLNINAVHRSEDLPPLDEGGDVYRVQMQMQDIVTNALAQKASAVRDLIDAGFDPTAAAETVGLPAMPYSGKPVPATNGGQP